VGSITIFIDLDGAGDELDRLMRGPGPETLARMEAGLLAGYGMSEAKVHVITGMLKASGHVSSSFDTDNWEGTMAWARHPGIFELARADTPTKYHQDGGHYFMREGGPFFLREVRHAIWDWITDSKDGPAPSLGLGPFSGGTD
jgi:hypothetical protein